MAIVKPFKGIMYNSGSSPDISDKVAPPYDVISPKLQTELYVKDPDNIVRIILGKTESTDEGDEIYQRASGYYQNWKADKILVRDKKPAFYVWDQTFSIDGIEYTRRALVGKVRCLPFSKKEVIPHEKTHKGPKIDRLKLFQSCGTQFSQVFSLYSDKDEKITKTLKKYTKTPILSAEYDGINNQLFRVTAPNALQTLNAEFKKQPLYIADGHHRYETSVKYFEEKNNHGSTLMTMVSMEDPGLVIMPTHRAVNAGISDFIAYQRLSRIFVIQKGNFTEWPEYLTKLNQSQGMHIFAFANRKLGISGIMKPLEPLEFDSPWKDRKTVWKNLDVSALHTVIFRSIFNMNTEDIFKPGPVFYSHSTEDCIDQLDNGSNWVFFLRPTRMEQLLEVADKGEVMPPKSTFFYPKYLSGFINAEF